MSYYSDPANLNQADRNGNGVISQGDSFQYGNIGYNEASSSSLTNFAVGDSTTVSAGGAAYGASTGFSADAGLGVGAAYGAGTDINSTFDQIDTNRDGVLQRSEFNRWNYGVGVEGSASGAVNVASSGVRPFVECNPPFYAKDAANNFVDPNPQVINRPSPRPALDYQQKIRVSFLQPPPLEPLRPQYIRQVRLPFKTQEPFRIGGAPKPAPPTTPLIIRERPPVKPQATTVDDKIEYLPAYVVPRSVIKEEYAPDPARPRDIELIRWIPYGAQGQRQVIRVPAPCEPYPPAPRNTIIRYEPVKVRVTRQFQRFGVTQADPEAYVRQYGANLLDSATFVQQARAAGVVDDISLPAYNASLQSTSGSFVTGAQLSGNATGGFVSGDNFGEVTATSSTTGGYDIAGAIFRKADINNDGVLDRSEFGNLLQGGL